MGAAAVFWADSDPSSWPVTAGKVGGPSSSFLAEAVAMCLTISGAANLKGSPLTVMTDSMAVIQAMQKWGREEYFKDMSRQLHADIIMQLLLLINNHGAHIQIIKVKSH